MSISTSSALPFYGVYPEGYTPPTSSTAATNASSGDIVDIRGIQGGTFTADAGDEFALSGLYTATAPSGSTIQDYQVALRNDGTATGGELILNGTVTNRTSFTALEFGELTYVAGASGDSQDLVVVAQTGTTAPDGTLEDITDSPAVQITANVTGTRSINAIGALRTFPTGSDASFVNTAQQASIFTGVGGGARPSVTTVGNFTADAGDEFALSGLYTATAPSGSTIQDYQVALRNDGTATGGYLLLNGTMTTRTSFTALEFGELTYVAGASGDSQDLVVVAQTGTTAPDGTLENITDSPAEQINADVTGTRSINATGALRTFPTGSDANFVNTAQQASIFTGVGGGARPSVTTVGNFTADAGDEFALSGLYTATAPSGSTIQDYQVALRNDGTATGGYLLLNGTMTTRTSFTALEFGELTYVAGASGDSQDLVVVAQTGTTAPDGTLEDITDSPAEQINADVTGTRSINATGALRTFPTGSDANFINTAQQASIFTGFNGARPSITTVGNLTADAGDEFALSGLYSATAPSGSTIQDYQVALRNDGTATGGYLLLNGTMTTRTSFTALEFGELTYVAGASGDSQDLVVVAQTGTTAPDGTLEDITDSPAVQINADVTGTRSINATGALRTFPTGSDANFVNTAQQASIFTGFNGSRPSVTTVGNFTADAGDEFALTGLYTATAPSGSTIQDYQVALRNDGTATGGELILNGTVTNRTSFTALEFGELTYVAGASGDSQDLVVVAQTGTTAPDGTLENITDSPAVQINADVSGTRSINAIGALRTFPTGSDANFVNTAQQAAIFTGVGGAGPTVTSVGEPDSPNVDPDDLVNLVGVYQSSQAILPTATATYDVGLQYGDAIGDALSSALSAQSGQVLVPWLLGDDAIGGLETGGSFGALQSYAIAAYEASQQAA